VHEPVVEPQFHIDLIDCSDWPDFATYRRTISENIRRDYRKAQQTSARVETRQGAAFRDIIALAKLRRYVMRKNGVAFSLFPDLFEHAAKLLVLGQEGFISTGRVDGKCLAAFIGTEFGGSLFYHAGGTRDNRLGVGSHLFLTLIEHWFAAHPNGRILIGDCPGTWDPSAYTHGAMLYRRKLRVRALDGLRFTIKYRRSDTAGS
jgi:Acetyltransferase (GNAT) domain